MNASVHLESVVLSVRVQYCVSSQSVIQGVVVPATNATLNLSISCISREETHAPPVGVKVIWTDYNHLSETARRQASNKQNQQSEVRNTEAAITWIDNMITVCSLF